MGRSEQRPEPRRAGADQPRRVVVPTARFDGWVERYEAAHGPLALEWSPIPGGRRGAGSSPDGSAVVAETFEADPVGVLLVRRGGYAVALVSGGRLVEHKVGTRRVQGRTAAGGWSQQRFARRREGQKDELVGAVAGHAARILLGHDPSQPARRAGLRVAGLVVGGDRALVGQLLGDPLLRPLAPLPRRELWDVPNPRRAALEDAARRGAATWVFLTGAEAIPEVDQGEA